MIHISNSLFFGDIDPNQAEQAIPAKELRRLLLSRLLFLDSIVLSDSQMLQDPRFRVMMSPTKLQEARLSDQQNDTRFDNLEEWQRGFECLLTAGLVEVACRSRKEKTLSLPQIWSDMRNSEINVPFLPSNEYYSKYIEKTGYTVRSYELTNVANRFRNNLQKGIEENAVRLDTSNPAHKEFMDLISADSVQLRSILSLLNDQMDDGAITSTERDLLYQFSFRCYSINVPAETGCYLSAKVKQIPLFLPSGTYDGVDGTAYIDPSKVRSSWSIDPAALDLLPIEAFVEIRRALDEEISSGFLLKAKEGNLQSYEEASEFYAVWDSYISKLEREMRKSLRVTRDKLNEITRKDYESSQIHLENEVTEFIINHIASKFPFIGTVSSILGLKKDMKRIIDSVIVLNQKQVQAYYPQYHDRIQGYLDSLYDNNASIITKY